MLYEKKYQPLAPRKIFYTRMLRSFLIGITLISLTVFLGMIGFITYEKMSWIDSFANSAMIASSVGTISPINTFNGKIFCGLFAIFSNLAFISLVGIIFGPLIHRVFHWFHLEVEEKRGK